VLARIQSTGTDAQRSAAAIALADVLAAQAQNDARRATSNWTGQTITTSSLLRKFNTARSSDVAAKNYEQLSSNDLLANRRAALTDAQAEQAKYQDQVDQLTAKLDKNLAERKKLMDERLALNTQAQSLRDKMFGATGQLRYDLYVKATTAARNADALGNQTDLINAENGVLETRRDLAAAHLNAATEQVKQIQAQIDSINENGKLMRQNADDSRNAAAQAADDLNKMVSEMTRQQEVDIIALFDSARAKMDMAVKTLEAAQSLGGQPGQQVKIALAGMQAEQGQLLRRYAIVLGGYRDLLSAMADQAENSLPTGKAGDLVNGAANAEKQVAQITTMATEAMRNAVASLEQVADIATAREAKIMIYQQMIDLNESLADMTGQRDDFTAAQAAQQKLDELTAQPE
jgi:hypothetical protein